MAEMAFFFVYYYSGMELYIKIRLEKKLNIFENKIAGLLFATPKKQELLTRKM